MLVMTKTVRIENACTNREARVIVQAQNQVLTDDGKMVWVDVDEQAALQYPTALASLTLWEGRRYVITEASMEPIL